jgi:ferredoxin
MKDSTKKLSKMMGLENSERNVHLYLYARYMPHYIYYMGKGAGLVQKPPAEKIPPEVEELIQLLALKVMREVSTRETSTYHGKVLPLELAEKLVSVEEDVELLDLERVIPYEIARDIVLVNPDTIAVFDCGCRSLQNEPCLPLDVCLAVGDPLASFMLEHEVLNARKVSSDEAVEILKQEHERGHVHAAYFKDVTGGRFYAICNCCSCCCLGMQGHRKMGLPMIASSGFVAKVEDGCSACGECVEICPFDALLMEDVAVVDDEKCMGCGVCVDACQDSLISLEAAPGKSEPLDIEKLIEESRDT